MKRTSRWMNPAAKENRGNLTGSMGVFLGGIPAEDLMDDIVENEVNNSIAYEDLQVERFKQNIATSAEFKEAAVHADELMKEFEASGSVSKEFSGAIPAEALMPDVEEPRLFVDDCSKKCIKIRIDTAVYAEDLMDASNESNISGCPVSMKPA